MHVAIVQCKHKIPLLVEPTLTWYTGNAENMGVTNEEAFQNVPRLVGVNDHSFTGGLGTSTDPNQ